MSKAAVDRIKDFMSVQPDCEMIISGITGLGWCFQVLYDSDKPSRPAETPESLPFCRAAVHNWRGRKPSQNQFHECSAGSFSAEGNHPSPCSWLHICSPGRLQGSADTFITHSLCWRRGTTLICDHNWLLAGWWKGLCLGNREWRQSQRDSGSPGVPSSGRAVPGCERQLALQGWELVLNSLAPSNCTPGTLLHPCRHVGTGEPGREGFLGQRGRQRYLGVCEKSWKGLVFFTQSSRWEPSCAQTSSDVTLCPFVGIYCYQGFEMLQKCPRTFGDAKFHLLAHPQPFRGKAGNGFSCQTW